MSGRMWPDRVSNPGPLTYESGALPTALRGPAGMDKNSFVSAVTGGALEKAKFCLWKVRWFTQELRFRKALQSIRQAVYA